MFPILKKQKLAENTYLMEIEAPEIAKKSEPGQFIMLRIDQKGERIPLTIADSNRKSITLIFLTVGRTTTQLSNLKKGDSLLDVVGPLGKATECGEFGTVCVIGGGLGIASVYPIGRAMKKAKNKIITIIGAKSKAYLFWDEKFREFSDELMICTDDGSKGEKGVVTDTLKKLMEREKIDLIIAVGPVLMMEGVSKLTKDRCKTMVSLNPIMLDGMGMCGCCRVIIKGKLRFSCVHGPEFNGHEVDWEELKNRNQTYVEEEG